MEQTAAIVTITVRYCTLCNEPGHRQKRARCKFRVCNKCGAAGHSATECTQTGCNECGSTTHETAMSFACPEHKCTNCEGTLEPKGHNRSDCPRMQTAICNECDETGHSANKCPFVRAMHVAFEVTNYNPAICPEHVLVATTPPTSTQATASRPRSSTYMGCSANKSSLLFLAHAASVGTAQSLEETYQQVFHGSPTDEGYTSNRARLCCYSLTRDASFQQHGMIRF
jgi:hypothetical protein